MVKDSDSQELRTDDASIFNQKGWVGGAYAAYSWGGGGGLGEGDVAASVDTDDSLALALHLARQQGKTLSFS